MLFYPVAPRAVFAGWNYRNARPLLGFAFCPKQRGFLAGDVKEKGGQFALLDAFVDARA